MTDENNSVWYGPHECNVCGVTIVKAALEDGGAEFEPPERLIRVYRRGSEAFDVNLVYPMTWKAHEHVAVLTGSSPRNATPTAPDCPPSDAKK